ARAACGLLPSVSCKSRRNPRLDTLSHGGRAVPGGKRHRDVAARPSFFAELKRRNVLRAAVLYAGAVWALSQGIAQLGSLFDAPNWAMRGFVIVCAIGFPFWVAFAWFYEFTPQGIKRESEVAPGESVTHSTARKLDFAIIGVMAVAIVLLASGYFIRRATP